MSSLKRNTAFLYRRLCEECSKELTFPLWLALIIRALAHLQSIAILFIATFPKDAHKIYHVLPVIRNITLITAIFPYFNAFASNILTNVLWGVFMAYFLIQMGSLGFLAVYSAKYKRILPKISRLISTLLLLHCKIISVPIHYFYLQFISKYADCDLNRGSNAAECSSAKYGLTVLLTVLNIIIPFLREFTCYKVTKTKSPFSCKSNFILQILLFQKYLTAFFFVIFPNSTTLTRLSSLINFACFTLVCFLAFYKLPAYKLSMVKISVTISTVGLLLSFIFILKAIGAVQDKSILELVFLLGVVFAVQGSLQALKNLTYKILNFQFSNPEQAVHLPILLKSVMEKNSPFPRLHRRYSPEVICYLGLLKSQGIDIKQMQCLEDAKLFEVQLYKAIIEKFKAYLSKNPHSEILKFCMAKIYLKKLKDPARALGLLQSIEEKAYSMAIKVSLAEAYKNFEKTFIKIFINKDLNLEVLEYFKYRDIANQIKKDMQHEISKHIEFWKELTFEAVDATKMIDIAQEIHKVFTHTQRLWKTYGDALTKTLVTPLLMYGVYLESVRDLPHESWPHIRKYFSIRKGRQEQKARNDGDLYSLSDSTAVLIGAYDPVNFGKITDASASVKNILSITKEKLIGKKFDVLFPSIFTKRHGEFLLSERGQMGIRKNRLIRTFDGGYITIDYSVNFLPSIENGIQAMFILKKIGNKDPTFIVARNGDILECSNEMEKVFKFTLGSGSKPVNIQQLSLDFENLCQAFNIAYGSDTNYNFLTEREPTAAATAQKGTLHNILSEDRPFLSTDPRIPTVDDRHLTPIVEESGRFSPRDSSRRLISEAPTPRLGPHYMAAKLSARGMTKKKLKQDQTPRKIMNGTSVINKEMAQDICKRHMEGVKMELHSVCDSKNSQPSSRKYKFIVKMEPMLIDGEYYQIIKLRSLNSRKEQATTGVFGQSSRFDDKILEIITKEQPDDEKFADDFPAVSEKNTELEDMKSTATKKDKKYHSTIINTEVFKDIFDNDDNDGLSDSIEFTLSQVQEDQGGYFFKKNAKDNDTSSVREGANSALRSIRVLQATFGREKLRPATKVTMLLVEIVMLIILGFAVLDYSVSSSSIDEIRAGVHIVDIASRRMAATTLAWQYLITLYTSLAKSAPFYNLVRSYIYQYTTEVSMQNDILKLNIQTVKDERLRDVFFEKSITMWDPRTHELFLGERLDSFTANNVLINMNNKITNWTTTLAFPASLNKLTVSVPLMFAVNNTANDFLVKSESQIAQAENVISLIITRNIDLLILIITLENLALFLLIFSLIIMIKVILKSHGKLFKTLAKIHQPGVLRRLDRLETLHALLDEDVELRKFGHDLSKYLETSSELQQAKHAKKNTIKYHEDRSNMNRLIIIMVKNLSLAFLILACGASLFALSFVSNRKDFNCLEQLSEKLSAIHTLTYQVNSIFSYFAHVTSFIGRSDLPIRNEDSQLQLNKTLEFLGEANNILMNSLLSSSKSSNEFTDDTIISFLKNDICSHMTGVSVRSCLLATQGSQLGLLGMNSKFLQKANYWISTFYSNLTAANGLTAFSSFTSVAGSDIVVIEAAYDWLTEYLMSSFEKEVDNQKEACLSFFLGMLTFAVISTVILQVSTIKRFGVIDRMIRRVLRIVPYEIILENKVFGFYLTQEFKSEVQGIKLQH